MEWNPGTTCIGTGSYVCPKNCPLFCLVVSRAALRGLSYANFLGCAVQVQVQVQASSGGGGVSDTVHGSGS